ncbi:hypothetical protein, partial [Klebsiella pneumoniae]|uniref:hypothetical protein n=1 Tax=Klebsiella pneumoniae TaxID=573 RepID=UPI001A9C4368
KACVLPENPASYRVVRKKSYLFNKALRLITASIKITPAAPAPGIALLFSYQDLRPHECDNH